MLYLCALPMCLHMTYGANKASLYLYLYPFTPAELGVGNCVKCRNGFPSPPRMAFESSAIRCTVCGPHSPWTLSHVSPSRHESDMFIFREGLSAGFSREGIYRTWRSMFNDSAKSYILLTHSFNPESLAPRPSHALQTAMLSTYASTRALRQLFFTPCMA